MDLNRLMYMVFDLYQSVSIRDSIICPMVVTKTPCDLIILGLMLINVAMRFFWVEHLNKI